MWRRLVTWEVGTGVLRIGWWWEEGVGDGKGAVEGQGPSVSSGVAVAAQREGWKSFYGSTVHKQYLVYRYTFRYASLDLKMHQAPCSIRSFRAFAYFSYILTQVNNEIL